MGNRTCGSSTASLWRAAAGAALVLAALGIAGCSFSPRMGLITPSPDSRGFVDQTTGQSFIPFGTNYYDPNTGWPPHVWSRFDPKLVKKHFEVMDWFHVDCARIFLSAAAFQPDPNTVDEKTLKKLDKLISIARRYGIRLIVTAPTDWEGEPTYWKPDRFTNEAAMEASRHLWNALGQRYRGEPVIFAWDIANEPQMPWYVESWGPLWNAWLQAKYANRDGLKTAWGSELADTEQLGAIASAKNVAVKGSVRLADWQSFREHLADQWVTTQVQMLRNADPTHLITMGYTQGSYPLLRAGDPNVYAAFNPRRQAEWLDFISVHVYPPIDPFVSRRDWDQDLAYLQCVLAYCQAGKPVVLGEYGWYGGGAPEGYPWLDEDQQSRWIMAEIEASRRLAQGWLSWPFADTPQASDMAAFGGMVEANTFPKEWGMDFKMYASSLAMVPQPMPELPSLDFAPSLTAPLEDMMEIHDKYAALVQAALEKAGSMPKIQEPEKKTKTKVK